MNEGVTQERHSEGGCDDHRPCQTKGNKGSMSIAWGIIGIAGLVLCCGICAGTGWLLKKRQADRAYSGLQGFYATVLKDAYIIRRMVESTSDGLVVQEMDGTVVWVNEAYCKMMGRDASEVIGQNPLRFVYGAENAPSEEEIAKFRYDEAGNTEEGLVLRENMRADGSVFWNQISVNLRTAPDGARHAFLVCRDVTEQIENQHKLEKAQAKLEHAANHDSLTGLANRYALLAFTERHLTISRQINRPLGLLRVDLDHFKEINDTHGHAAGDAMLVNVARVLQDCVRHTDLTARIGGDEFVVVCPEIDCAQDLLRIAQELSEGLARPVKWQGRTLQGSASIGAVMSQLTKDSAEDMLIASDLALYEVKRKNRGTLAVYDEALRERHRVHIERANALRKAIDNRCLDFYAQPTLNLRTGQLSGFEMLLRWHLSDGQVLAPDTILPLADEMGLTAQIDMCAIDAAIDLKERLNEMGHDHLRVGINASADALAHPEYISYLEAAVRRTNIDPNQIAIEVLETVILDHAAEPRDHAAIVSRLHALGFHTMLDDFGVGHAGLAHLADLSLSGVKIDRSLVSRILTEGTSEKIVSMLIELCRDLDLRIVAEGVETAEIADRLGAMGCNVIQGYWIARPMPLDQVEAFVTAHRAPTVRLTA